MKEISEQLWPAISGGDRWCDGQDWKNHPAPEREEYVLIDCKPHWISPNVEVCTAIKATK